MIKSKKADEKISWFYIAIFLLGLVALAFLIALSTGTGTKIKTILFGAFDSWFG